MTLLGIDFGTKNIGLAIATTPLAEPLQTIKNSKEVAVQLRQICDRLKVEKVIIGTSEGEMAKIIESFADKLRQHLDTPVGFQDETLTSKLVQNKLKEAHASRKKRRGPDHAFAATLMLQRYLDEHEAEGMI